MSQTFYSGDPTTVLDSTSGCSLAGAGKRGPQMAPGTVVKTADGKKWKYVQLADEETVVGTKYAPVYYTDVAHTIVTPDYSGGIGGGANNAAGIWILATTTAGATTGPFDTSEGTYYAFIQIGGVVGAGTALCPADGDAAAGDLLTCGADSTFTHVNAGTAVTITCVGVVVLAIDTGKVGAYLYFPE
jgi:hypothetical protein